MIALITCPGFHADFIARRYHTTWTRELPATTENRSGPNGTYKPKNIVIASEAKQSFLLKFKYLVIAASLAATSQ